MKLREIYLKSAGIFLFLIGVLAIILSIVRGYFGNVFYFCYIGLILIGLGMFFKKNYLILSQLNILLIPLIVWSIDYFYQLFTGNVLWGITDYMFNYDRGFLDILVSLQHIYTIPLGLIGLYFVKIKSKKIWIFSIIQIIIIYFLTLFFSNKNANINWVYFSTFNLDFPWPYFISWFLFFSLIIVITNFILIKVFEK